ncbi:amino acid ABC transporter permease [uncultured Clostridium sp.]|uniref:amino acid ABC transporter permease n=1 Tax=uncultured Clostridium sp. TaxID=59620 RepID=UPI0028EE8212|nr:amino acid ABC transporter permease [uncultured Clostridium sp.]
MSKLYNTILFILKGSNVTLSLFLIVLIISIPLAIVFSLIRMSKNKVCSFIIGVYIWIFRGTPLLIQLFFIYFGMPYLGLKISRFNAAVITFTLNYSAYFTEIFRYGIQSIDKGQYEASKALGMDNYQMMKRVIIPQVVKRVIPATCNEVISLIKDTSLVAIIGMEEILRASKEIMTRDFTLVPFIICGIIYLIFGAILVMLFKRLEIKYSYYE